MFRRNLSLILAIVALVLALAYVLFGWFGSSYNAEAVPYPLLMAYHRTIFIFVVLVVLGTAIMFVLTIIRLITQHRRLDSERPARRTGGLFILFLIATFMAVAAALPATFVSAQHLSSASSGGHVYNLSFWQFIDGDHRYIFYECDALGFMCQQRHVQYLNIGRSNPADRAVIITSETANIVALEIDGERVYSSEF